MVEIENDGEIISRQLCHINALISILIHQATITALVFYPDQQDPLGKNLPKNDATLKMTLIKPRLLEVAIWSKFSIIYQIRPPSINFFTVLFFFRGILVLNSTVNMFNRFCIPATLLEMIFRSVFFELRTF